MANSPQPDQPPAEARPEPPKPPQEALPTTPDPALINITEKGREPHQTRIEPDR